MASLLRVKTLSILFLVQILFVPTLVGFIFSGCSSAEKKSDTPEGAYAIAQEYDKDARYEDALRHYQEVKNKFPYSKFAIMSELSMADVSFKEESYAEAQVAYQAFKDLHPKHPQIDYVTYRLGMSFFNQLPSTVDRDLSQANPAIQAFDEELHNFPTSKYAKEAAEKKQETLKKLAEKEIYIADFYFKTGKYNSAAARYEEQIKKYPIAELDAHSYLKATRALAKAGDLGKAKQLLEEFKTKYPDSREYRTVEKELK